MVVLLDLNSLAVAVQLLEEGLAVFKFLLLLCCGLLSGFVWSCGAQAVLFCIERRKDSYFFTVI